MAKIITVVIAVVIIFISCRDIFEANLTQEQQVLLFPVDGTIQTNVNVTFMWEEVKGATDYRLQIAMPNFTSPQLYVLDSVVTGTEFTTELYPGMFEWRVRAQNYSSYTDYSTPWSLTIDSSYDLTTQSLLLYTPTDAYYTNATAVTFNWQNLYSADSYNFILKSGAIWSSGTVLENVTIAGTSYTSTYNFTEGNYMWSVRGENLLPSYTPYATERILNVDQTVPATPIGLLPGQFTTGLLADSIYLFDWTRPVDPGTIHAPLFDSVYMYLDTNQLPIARYYTAVEDMPIVLPSTPGTYYWRVKTFDDAGNTSSYSNTNTFTVL